jgi:hypothetical protein
LLQPLQKIGEEGTSVPPDSALAKTEHLLNEAIHIFTKGTHGGACFGRVRTRATSPFLSLILELGLGLGLGFGSGTSTAPHMQGRAEQHLFDGRVCLAAELLW